MKDPEDRTWEQRRAAYILDESTKPPKRNPPPELHIIDPQNFAAMEKARGRQGDRDYLALIGSVLFVIVVVAAILIAACA